MAEVPKHIEFTLSRDGAAWIIGLESEDGTNRFSRALVNSLADEIEHFGSSGINTAYPPLALIIDGTTKFFSAGADLNEISQLTGPEAYEFALMGQRLMNAVDNYPAPVIASI